MLPRITPEFTVKEIYLEFLADLRNVTFSGEINMDYATRLSAATDNSVYQVIPQAVIFPRSKEDVEIILRIAKKPKYQIIKFCPRGGGTSTNGQSLSTGIIIDCSKHMTKILELNLAENWVRVQPGVVLDQLNTYLQPHGVHFAPEISPSNRATIGGMVNTDACGVGSRILGRTSDHVLNLTCILSNGQTLQTSEFDTNNECSQKLIEIIAPHQALIEEKFTSAPRTLNGYNLKKAYTTNQQLNLNYLFCGSEGTLAIVAECKLKLTPIAKFKKVLVVKYHNFDAALRVHGLTADTMPLIIEAIDEKLIALARQDAMFFQLKDFIDGAEVGADIETGIETQAINIMEFVADDEDQLTAIIEKFTAEINKNKHLANHALGFYLAKNPTEEKLLWDLRKKSVGLISQKSDGTRRPIPFIEDTAVPPEYLADYITELKTLLDKHNLVYGMYGHVDAGCVHVRPALDLKLSADENLMRELSDNVVALIEKYGGVLWGEHGHGHRSEYGVRFFGEKLYFVVRQIKTLFDPLNQFNPGKIAIPLESAEALAKLDGPLRGHLDRQISTPWRDEFANPLVCNGNGACFDYATAATMCPSFKATKDRIHSPKGRATMMREWLRQLAKETKFELNVFKRVSFFSKIIPSLNKQADFSHEVYSAMAGCLGCKACTSQCPLNVDVPEFKSKFLAFYHQRYLRSWRDYLFGWVESLAPLLAYFPRVTNEILQSDTLRSILKATFKMVDPPLIGTLSIQHQLRLRKAPHFDLLKLKNLSEIEKSRSVILLQDTFTSYYEPTVLLATYDFLTKMGFAVYVAPFFANGKPLHAQGFLTQFTRVVERNSVRLTEFSELNISLVGIDPSITLTYRDEYQKFLRSKNFTVLLLQEWLVTRMASLPQKQSAGTQSYYLLSHCTEKTMYAQSEKDWEAVFAACGLTLMSLPAGCCGMAGSFGYEAEHAVQSRALFAMDWKKQINKYPGSVVATGYSCRSQAQRLMKMQLQHPMQVLCKDS